MREPPAFLLAVGEGLRLLWVFFFLFSSGNGELHGDPRERRKRKGGEEEGKGEKVARGAAAYRLQGLGSGMGPHTRTRTHAPKGMGGGRLGREQSSLKHSVLLLWHQSSQEGERKEKRKAQEKEEGMQSSPSLPLLLQEEEKSLPTQRAAGKRGMKQSGVSIGSVQPSRFPLPSITVKR